MGVNHRGFFIALSLIFVAGTDTAFALTCGSPHADFVVNGPHSSENIHIGVAVSAKIVDNPAPGAAEVVGELKIIETLRGTSPGTLALELSPPEPAWGTPGLQIGRPYLVLQSAIDAGVYRIGVCTYPLQLDAEDVTFGDGCKLYRMRELLGIDQRKSRACEVVNRRMNRRINNHNVDREAMQEELLRAKWLDAGVDWSG